MRIDEITIEVRDENLGRVGQIDLEMITDLSLIKRLNNVGAWSMTLPVEYPMAKELAVKGRGIIVLGPNNLPLMSGRMLNVLNNQTVDDPQGTWTFIGVDDNIHLADALAWPQPGNADASTQTVAYDVRTGIAEDVMRQYVAYNIGDGSTREPPASWATPERMITGFALEPVSGNRGAVVTGRARFDQLGLLLGQLASVGGLGFDTRQNDDKLVFTIYEPQDKSSLIRMDIANDMLETVSYGFGAPSGTRVIVASQGQGVDRTFKQFTDVTSAVAESEWRRKIEIFKDRRDTNDTAEIDQEGLEQLENNGRTVTSLAVKPSDTVTMAYGVDWYLGDIVTVVVNEQQLTATVTESIISIGEGGIRVGAIVGDPTGFDYESKMIAKQKDTEKRLAFLEKNAEATDTSGIEADVTAIENRIAPMYLPRQTVYFTSGGTFSKASYPWLKAVRVRVVGGGGGGGGSAAASGGNHSVGGGGAGGGYAESFILADSLSSNTTVTVGAGGSRSVGGTGGTGGTSSFGSHVVATGGVGGAVKPNSVYSWYVGGSEGGVGTTGTLKVSGAPGPIGGGYAGLGSGGPGGGSMLGGGAPNTGAGAGGGSYDGADAAPYGYGGGGSGAQTNSAGVASRGGLGAAGIVIVELYG